jgi:LacI family transcriptional regulator
MSTMVEVARRAKVSIATVSGVLSGSRYVSPELRQRVLDAVGELDYTVNQIARSLQSRRTHMAGMLVPDISDPFHASVVHVVEESLRVAGYSLILGSLHDQPEEQSRYIQILKGNQVDGLLLYLVPGHEAEIRRLVEMKKPIVLMGRAPQGFQADVVATDHVAGTRLAIEHLIAKGHARIGILPGPASQTYSADRVTGWRAALTKANLPANPCYIGYGEFSFGGGWSAASALLDLSPPPTALFAGNFHVLIGILRFLRLRKISRPRDIELMVSHDSEVLDAFDPPISSVDQPSHELGIQGAELLLKRIRQPGRPFQKVLLRPKLKIRS